MGLDFDITIKNIEYLISHYPKKMVHIRAIPYEWPLGEVLKVKRYWKERNVPVKIFLPNSRTGLLDNCASWNLKYPGNKLKGCKKTLPLRDMVISSNGDVVLCCEDMARKVILGNVKRALSAGSLEFLLRPWIPWGKFSWGNQALMTLYARPVNLAYQRPSGNLSRP